MKVDLLSPRVILAVVLCMCPVSECAQIGEWILHARLSLSGVRCPVPSPRILFLCSPTCVPTRFSVMILTTRGKPAVGPVLTPAEFFAHDLQNKLRISAIVGIRAISMEIIHRSNDQTDGKYRHLGKFQNLDTLERRGTYRQMPNPRLRKMSP